MVTSHGRKTTTEQDREKLKILKDVEVIQDAREKYNTNLKFIFIFNF